MVNLRARYYAPWQGRFLSRDAWEGDYEKPMSYNLWLYGYANPISYQDPTGNYGIQPPACPSSFYPDAVRKRVDLAQTYVHRTNDEIDTYVAGGIAIQCAGWGKSFDPNSGLGIAQISKNVVETPYMQPIYLEAWGGKVTEPDKDGNPKPVVRAYGLRRTCPNGELEPVLDPNNPDHAVILMKRRIELVLEFCSKKGVSCTKTDEYIAAALAQNGSGFSHIRMGDVRKISKDNINWFMGKYGVEPDIVKDWFKLFLEDARDNYMIDTRTQLVNFSIVIIELMKRGWFVPNIDINVIRELKKVKPGSTELSQ